MKYFLLITLLLSCGRNPIFQGAQKKTPIIQGLQGNDIFKWDDNINFALKWNKNPKVGVDSPFEVKFWKSNLSVLGPYIKLNQKLCVFLWMNMPSGMSHGSSPLILNETNESYSLNEVFFIMKGKWDIHIRTVENENQCSSDISDEYIKESIVSISL